MWRVKIDANAFICQAPGHDAIVRNDNGLGPSGAGA